MATPARVLLFGLLLAIALVAIAAFLLNVPPLAIGRGAIVVLLALFVWLSRHGVGKRSGSAPDREDSRTQ